MMEYAQYQQQAPPGQHHGQMQSAYPSSGQHPGPGAAITSPTNQPLHQQHSMSQSSPILPSQQNQGSQAQGHPVQHNMGYQPQYSVPPQGMHYGMPGISTQ